MMAKMLVCFAGLSGDSNNLDLLFDMAVEYNRATGVCIEDMVKVVQKHGEFITGRVNQASITSYYMLAITNDPLLAQNVENIVETIIENADDPDDVQEEEILDALREHIIKEGVLNSGKLYMMEF